MVTEIPAPLATEEAASPPTARPTSTRIRQTATPRPTRRPASAVVVTSPASTQEAAPTLAGDPIVQPGGNARLGAFLVDGEGRTLYVYANDEPGWSNCVGTCLNNWQVYTVEADTPLVVGAGLDGELGLTERADGTLQVTYDDQPLYYFSLDRRPGDAIGSGAGNVWSVVPVGE